jgi:glucosamine--fructose-6-phosphate aminotransferase (isomerizing)
VLTCARGSSDHAATYAKYMIETLLGVPTASAAFSTVSLYDAPLRADGANPPLCIAISQSGHSPDMLATVERYKASGALVVALVNNDQSPLAQLADVPCRSAPGRKSRWRRPSRSSPRSPASPHWSPRGARTPR